MIDYIAWQADNDAYTHSGQQCTAQSVMFVHKKWAKTNLYEQL
jgi:1-pyrroline-5-carboxylate dehydrogenase